MLLVELDSPLARGCALSDRREQVKNMRRRATTRMLPRCGLEGRFGGGIGCLCRARSGAVTGGENHGRA